MTRNYPNGLPPSIKIKLSDEFFSWRIERSLLVEYYKRVPKYALIGRAICEFIYDMTIDNKSEAYLLTSVPDILNSIRQRNCLVEPTAEFVSETLEQLIKKKFIYYKDLSNGAMSLRLNFDLEFKRYGVVINEKGKLCVPDYSLRKVFQ